MQENWHGTKTTKLTRIVAAAVALTLGMSGVAMAETASSMRGQIVGPHKGGSGCANTRVIIRARSIQAP